MKPVSVDEGWEMKKDDCSRKSPNQLMAGHVSSIPVDIVEGAIESIGALTSMEHMKAYSCISYQVGLGLTNVFIDLRVRGI
jgi:hypothetical protein